MHRPRHRSRSSARFSFSLLSVLALLALAAFPAFSQADSGEKIYETDRPDSGVTNEVKPGRENPLNEDEAKAHASTQPSGGGGGSESSQPQSNGGGGEPSSEESQGNPGTSGGGGDKNPPSGGEGSPSKEDSTPGKTGVGQGEPVSGPASENVSHHSSSDDGSSPLVPILIAIAILAAISIGAVVYRQRRGDSGGGSGSPVSPKAG